jgi:hypothetical protein
MAAQKGIDPTVGNFLLVLSSKLTQYDQKEMLREMKRGGRGNIYRLGHLLGALQKVREDMAAREADTVDPELGAQLISSIEFHFTSGFRPMEQTIKQILDWANTKKRPSLVR